MPNFSDKHVVVTGGTGALGSAVVSRLIDEGAHVHIPYFSEEEASRFALAEHPNVSLSGPVDLGDEDKASRFFESLPPIWASVHLAGGFSMAPFTETSLVDFNRLLTLNARTCFLGCREAVKSMRKGPGGGRIVNVAARPVLSPAGGTVAYAASKAAVATMTTCLAEEFRDESIWVNAVVPSLMDTPANRAAMPDADHRAWPKVADVAAAIAFLASEENMLTTGTLVPVYGRLTS